MPADKKLSYAEMIQDAINVLREPRGSTRQELWKAVTARHMAADHKQFLLRLRRLSKEGTIVQQNPKNRARFQLTASLRAKVQRAEKKTGARVTHVQAALTASALLKKEKAAARSSPRIGAFTSATIGRKRCSNAIKVLQSSQI